MEALSMSLSELWPSFQGHDIFEVEYLKRRVLKTKLLLHNRKVYVIYGMVLCLLTLTDLQTCRAGLSASADLLVHSIIVNLSSNISIPPHSTSLDHFYFVFYS